MGAFMTLCLCEYEGYRMLCYASSNRSGATLSAGPCGDWAHLGFKKSRGSPFDWIMVVRSSELVRFYPEAKWRGTPVHVAMWSWGQADPRPYVGCSLNLHEIDQQRWFGTTGLKYAELIAPCAELGWRVDLRDHSAYGAVPIDELELVEGPPPEGAF